jgi:hypothetical protein
MRIKRQLSTLPPQLELQQSLHNHITSTTLIFQNQKMQFDHLLTPPPSTQFNQQLLPQQEVSVLHTAFASNSLILRQAPPHNEEYPPDEMDDSIPFNFNHNALGLLLDPLFLHEHDGVEEVSNQSSPFLASRLNAIQQASHPPPAPRLRPIDLPEVEFDQGHDGLDTDNNHLPVGQLADEFDGQHVFAGQSLLPAQGGIVLDEELAPPPQEDPLNLSSRPAIDLYDTFVTQGVVRGTIESWRTIMK